MKRLFGVLFALVLVFSLLVIAIPAAPALAAESLSVSPSNGEIGDEIDVSGSGYDPGDKVYIYFSSEEADKGDDIEDLDAYERVTTTYAGGLGDADEGEIDTSFDVPSELTDGDVDEDVHYGEYYVYTAYSDDEILDRCDFTVIAIELDPEQGNVGDEVEISGVGFRDDRSITVKYDGDEIDISSGDEKTDDDGEFELTIIIPKSTAGDHTISVKAYYEAEAEFTVEPKITISPTSGSIGDEVTVNGTGFGKTRYVTIYFNNVIMTLTSGTARTDSDGSFDNLKFNVPAVAAGTCNVKARDTANNTATAEFTAPAMKGDFDGDGDIDIFDFVQFADAYGSETGDPNYNAIGDFNDDGYIDIFDFVYFADVYGHETAINEWDEFAYPDSSEDGDWFWDIGIYAIGPIAEAIDGTLYAFVVGPDNLFNSTDGGRTWAETDYADDLTGEGAIVDIACSRLDEEIVYVADEDYVYKTDDGGDTWDDVRDKATLNLGANEVITCLAVGYDDDEAHVYIGTADGSAGGGVYNLLDEAFGGGWADLELDYDVYGIGCSPDFDSDALVVAVATSGTETFVCSNKGATTTWDKVELENDFGDPPGDPDNNLLITEASDPAFPEDFDADDAYELFVGVVGEAHDGGEGGVYRLYDTNFDLLDDVDVDIISLDLVGEIGGTLLLAGVDDAADVWYSWDDVDDWDVASVEGKNPSGNGPTYVVMDPDFDEDTGIAWAATAGAEGAVSMTVDGGVVWNQISLIATEVTCVLDLDHSPGYLTDSETLFMVTEYADEFGVTLSTSLFRYDGTFWERVFCSTIYLDSDENPIDIEMVQVSPDFLDTEVVFVAKKSDTDPVIYRSTDAGNDWDELRAQPEALTQFWSWVVLDEDTIMTGGDGVVYRTERHGRRRWDDCELHRAAGNVRYFGIDITDDTETILVGDDESQVFICVIDPDKGWGDQDWDLVGDCQDVLTGTNDTSVAFDPGYAVSGDEGENTIYAAAGNMIARCVIDWDEDMAYQDLFWDPEISAVGPIAKAIDGTLYAYAAVDFDDDGLAEGDYVLFNSTDGGRTWEETDYDGEGAIVDIACSSLDADILYVTDGNYVYKSDDAGDEWGDLEDIATLNLGANEVITCLAVGYDDDEAHVYIGTADGSAGGGVYHLLDEAFGGGWVDLDLGCYRNGYYSAYSIGCAPDFATSKKTFVVVSDGSETHVISTISVICDWDEFAELVWDCVSTNHFGISAASRIGFPDDWEDTETLFVGVVGSGANGGDVYSVTEDGAIDLNVRPGTGGCVGNHPNIRSLDVCGGTDDGSQIAGANDNTSVYYSSDGGWEWDPSEKDPTGERETYVLWVGDDCGGSAMAATSGCECALSLSCGEEVGECWNQISLFATDVTCVWKVIYSSSGDYYWGIVAIGDTALYVCDTDDVDTDDGGVLRTLNPLEEDEDDVVFERLTEGFDGIWLWGLWLTAGENGCPDSNVLWAIEGDPDCSRVWFYTVSGEVAMKGDFDGDGDIDIFDFVYFADAYYSEAGDPNYNAIGDFDNDGDIDIFDFVQFADVYGT